MFIKKNNNSKYLYIYEYLPQKSWNIFKIISCIIGWILKQNIKIQSFSYFFGFLFLFFQKVRKMTNLWSYTNSKLPSQLDPICYQKVKDRSVFFYSIMCFRTHIHRSFGFYNNQSIFLINFVVDNIYWLILVNRRVQYSCRYNYFTAIQLR